MNNYEKVAVFPWTVEYEVREKGAIGNYQRKDIRVIAETKEEAGREALKIIHRNYPNLEPRMPIEIIQIDNRIGIIIEVER